MKPSTDALVKKTVEALLKKKPVSNHEKYRELLTDSFITVLDCAGEAMKELTKLLVVNCGNANPNGNVSLLYKGGCGKDLPITDAYRCTGCGGWFHKDCILKHFELEKKHDWGRHEERTRIRKVIKGMMVKIEHDQDYIGKAVNNVLKAVLRKI